MFRNANACLTPPVAASLVSPRGRRFGALCIQNCREIKMEMVSFFLKAARCPCELPPVKQVCSLVVMIRWFCTMLRLLCICSRDPANRHGRLKILRNPARKREKEMPIGNQRLCGVPAHVDGIQEQTATSAKLALHRRRWRHESLIAPVKRS
jgi:hypothetical protein